MVKTLELPCAVRHLSLCVRPAAISMLPHVLLGRSMETGGGYHLELLRVHRSLSAPVPIDLYILQGSLKPPRGNHPWLRPLLLAVITVEIEQCFFPHNFHPPGNCVIPQLERLRGGGGVFWSRLEDLSGPMKAVFGYPIENGDIEQMASLKPLWEWHWPRLRVVYHAARK